MLRHDTENTWNISCVPKCSGTLLWEHKSYCLLVIHTAYLHKGNTIYTKTISRQKQLKHNVACLALGWREVNVHPFCDCIAFHVPKCCSAQWKCCHLVGDNYPTPLDVKQKCSIFIDPYSTDCTRNALLYGWNMPTLLSYIGFWSTIYIYFWRVCVLSLVMWSNHYSTPVLGPHLMIYLPAILYIWIHVQGIVI